MGFINQVFDKTCTLTPMIHRKSSTVVLESKQECCDKNSLKATKKRKTSRHTLIVRNVPLSNKKELLKHFSSATDVELVYENDKFTGVARLMFPSYKKIKKVIENEALRTFKNSHITLEYLASKKCAKTGVDDIATKVVKSNKSSRFVQDTGPKKSSQNDDNKDSKKVCIYKFLITNLTYDENNESLTKTFQKYGTVHKVIIMTNRDGYCTGSAKILFNKMFKRVPNEIICRNRTIFVKYLHESTKIFISNIDKALNKEKICNYLKKKNIKVQDIRIQNDRRGQNRGYCFIDFDNEYDIIRFRRWFKRDGRWLGSRCTIEAANQHL